MNNNNNLQTDESRSNDERGSPEESAPPGAASVIPANEGESENAIVSSQSAPVASGSEDGVQGTVVASQTPASVENVSATQHSQLTLVPSAPAGVVPGNLVFSQAPMGNVQTFLGSAMATLKRQLERGPQDEEMPKRPKVGLKALVKNDRSMRRGRRPVTVDADEVRARAHVKLEDLLGENSRTNVHFTTEEVIRLNDFIRTAGNIRGDITKSGLSLLVLVRHAEELWMEMRSKYSALEREARTERAERLLLDERVQALENHNNSQSPMEVDQVPLSEFIALKEQNTVLAAKVEELTITIAEYVNATPVNTNGEAALTSELTSLREENSALKAEVAALKLSISNPSESQPSMESTELSKLQQEILSLRSRLKSKEDTQKVKDTPTKSMVKSKDNRPKKPSKQKGSAAGSNNDQGGPSPSLEVPGNDGTIPEGTPSEGDGFTLVKRKKPRKPKVRMKSEAVAIKASEAEYANILKKLRRDPNLAQLGRETKTVRRTRQNELLLVLNKGAKHESQEYARLVTEAVGSGDVKVRSLGTETTLQCKNLDETVTAEVLLEAITTQCDTGPLNTPVQLRRYSQGTQTATFKLPASLANMVLKVGKIKVNWSVCPITVFERPAICFKCLGYDHKSWDCKGPDRSKMCRRCGAEGHKANGCKAKPKCLICTEGGNHATGSSVCPSFKSALKKMRPCR